MADAFFTGTTALVTGAASGIGEACAKWLSARGAGLVPVDISESLAPCPLTGCRYVGDVADEALWARIEQEVPALDFAVLCAGRSDAASIIDLELAPWRALMATNLDGLLLSLRTALRRMVPARRGAIVILASAAGLKAEPGVAAYGASKAAAIHLAKVAAKEAAPAGVRVNALAPGGVDTPIWDNVPMFREMVAQEGGRAAAIAALGRMATPLGRYASADEIAAQAGFLPSEAAATITGAVLCSDGGYTL